ncbi:MAG: hypothetical protein AAF358_18045 [Pseudomonadota bacterium]
MKRVISTALILAMSVTAAIAGSSDNASSSKISAKDRMNQWKQEGRRLSFIDRHDHDGDARVSTIEFEQSRRDRFDLTDADNNGVVTVVEYQNEWEDRMDAQLELDRRARVKQAEVRFGAMDKNDNDVMEWEEYAASGDRMFTRRDTNEDLVVDAMDPPSSYSWTPKPDSELTAEELQQRRDRQIAYARNMLEMPTTHNLEGMMVKYDQNADERIDREEFDVKRRADFDHTDFDGNGVLTAEEYVSEFEDRMDEAIESFRVSSIKQSKRRFESLDDDASGEMSFAEYRESGNRIFARYDVSGDGYIAQEDPMPVPFEEEEPKQEIAANAE